jgi:hypothetical protein
MERMYKEVAVTHFMVGLLPRNLLGVIGENHYELQR